MEFYLFRHAQWEALYNCSYDVDIIPVEQRVNVTHGLLMISLASLFLLIYLLPLCVIMFNCLDKSAYQIMFLIGIYDVLSLVIDAIRLGIMSIYGHVFCSLPVFSYIAACFCMAAWVSSKECCIILFVYRCLELWRPNVADVLFKGKRTFVWIGLSLLHFVVVVFMWTPGAYNPMIGTLVQNPHAGYIDDPEGKERIRGFLVSVRQELFTLL
ncbi:serpentine type 7TM GPCR chemoreceptor srt domain-containing protein [Ditylenchus destructor]|nr:serpentine type 7TM GPCR chemoreceptor srt domain-containing protein [Ditylenchus destructor]